MTTLNQVNKCADLFNKVQQPTLDEFTSNLSKVEVMNKMFAMQNELQEFVTKSKPNSGNLAPKDCDPTIGSHFSIYYFGCATAEYAELLERMETYSLDNDNIDKLETQYEYIDIWHFLMNICLYSGVDSISGVVNNYSINNFYEESLMVDSTSNLDWKSYLVESYGLDMETNGELVSLLNRKWGEFTSQIGNLINELPYKKWKTYNESTSTPNMKNVRLYAETAIDIFIDISKLLGITYLDFVTLYLSKNLENHARQTRGY